MAFHLALENGRDVERRQVQRHGLRIDLDPAHHVVAAGHGGIVLPAAPALERLPQFLRAPQAVGQALAARRLAVQVAAEFGDRIGQALQSDAEGRLTFQPGRWQALVLALHRQAQVPRRLVQGLRRLLQRRVILGTGDAFVARVARQFDDLAGRHALAEEQARHLGQLVGLVEDDGVAGRQQFAHAFVLEHHVGEEQVVVDHHHVGRQRVLARGHDEAALGVRAFLAQAVLARRGGQAPGPGILRHVDAFGLVACLRTLGEAGDLAQVRRLLARSQPPGAHRAFQVIGTDVVGAALEQRDRGADLERIAHRRQVAVEQLVLQGLGTGRDDDLAPRLQRRHQVGEGLAGAGTGLGHQCQVAGDGLCYALRHLQLLRPRTKAGHGGGERPLGGEDAFKV